MEYTEDKLSGWFDIDKQKPWEPGVYEIQRGSNEDASQWISYWDGARFNWCALGVSSEDIKRAYGKRMEMGSGLFVIRWRGLANDPAKPAAPKKRANKRKTMYVAMYEGEPLAAFDTKAECIEYVKRGNICGIVIKHIRFRIK